MDAQSGRQPPRWLHPTTRSDVQVTWHDTDDLVVISLWRDGTCVASAPLPIADAASLAKFLVGHLAQRAQMTTPDAAPQAG